MIEKCYVHNIFTKNYKWLVIIGYNLNLLLKLLFYPTNNNLPLKICCKNIVNIAFLLTILFKLSKNENLMIFWVSKNRSQNRVIPLNSSINKLVYLFIYFIF